LALTEEGKYFEAWREIVRSNPFPACMGRACYRCCEKACNRALFDESVSIRGVERFLGDKAIQEGWSLPSPAKRSDAKKVLVVGAGPSGLSAAYHLALRGHKVTVLERCAEAGGMMRYGIPSYRLGKDVLRAEIGRILGLGVTLRPNTDVFDLAVARQGFDACYLAIGTWKARRLEHLSGPLVSTALDFLKDEDAPSRLSGCVAICGGGNTAFDAARTAKRSGAERVVVIYRKAIERLSAHKEEIFLAQQDGIEIMSLRVILGLSGNELTLDVMQLGENKDVLSSGRTERLAISRLILAIGQDVDTTLLESLPHISRAKDGAVEVNSSLATLEPGIFAGGDMVPSSRTLAEAIGHGEKAARTIDNYLSGVPLPPKEKYEIAAYTKLNTHYYEHAPRNMEKRIPGTGFQEVFATFAEQEAVCEARRCFSCGSCFMCDTCYGVCPDNAICKHRPSEIAANGLTFSYDYCKGCGICARECPCGYIKMVSEEK
jgi:NADPH-dependent glutamate synthase beta subunit-like oxidoreductase